ncbi:kinase-like domain-containing protein [Mycena metata]|uniref:Kinase-like domain-containing protein n=1 Tax=Mycena metata TaxID=1033252 RepID=A0AAD7E0Q9_9AGAR|nr:kinase-like domain-containing protein [Mycena metata]KAJ7753854.1 kinase-like domain-containing protein [Mycena metata]
MASRLLSEHSQVALDLTESLGEFPLLTSQITTERYATAQGGFSDVYRGQYTRLRHAHRAHCNTCFTTKVAVKVLRVTENCSLERALKHLKKEATVWMQLDDIHVAKFYGVAEVGGRPALVLEWCNQGTATDYLKGQSLVERLRVIQSLATGLVYVHSRNVVHGDLKGSNVLISNEFHAVLSDFGLSRNLERHTGHTTSTHYAAGSLNWLSPELIRPWFQPDEARVKTLASDIWAFACTVYELLTDTAPYASLPSQTFLQIAETIKRHITPLEALPAQPVQIPDRIRNILEQCWALQPAERPSMAEVVEMLSV